MTHKKEKWASPTPFSCHFPNELNLVQSHRTLFQWRKEWQEVWRFGSTWRCLRWYTPFSETRTIHAGDQRKPPIYFQHRRSPVSYHHSLYGEKGGTENILFQLWAVSPNNHCLSCEITCRVSNEEKCVVLRHTALPADSVDFSWNQSRSNFIL